MANSFFGAPPQQFVLAPSPRLHLLRTGSVFLSHTDLQGDDVHYIIADWRCDQLKAKLCKTPQVEDRESFEVYCGFDMLGILAPLRANDNWWTSVCSWVYNKVYRKKGLSLVMFSEGFVGTYDTPRKFDTYVDFLRPDVTIVAEYWRATGLHDRLLDFYNDCERIQLSGDADNVLWFFFNSWNVSVRGETNSDAAFVEINRVECSPSSVNGNLNNQRGDEMSVMGWATT